MIAMRLRASHTLVVEPVLPGPLEPLLAIANNLYWTWNTDARALFERIDPLFRHSNLSYIAQNKPCVSCVVVSVIRLRRRFSPTQTAAQTDGLWRFSPEKSSEETHLIR